MKGWDARLGLKPQPKKVIEMRCVICGRKAKYNEKLNVYYCEIHGFTTWMEEEIPKIEEALKNEAVLG